MPEITESAEDLKGLLRHAKKKHEIQRLNALYLLKSKQAKNCIQVAETFGVEMNYKAVYAMVHDKWGAKLKVSRKSHAKKRRRVADLP